MADTVTLEELREDDKRALFDLVNDREIVSFNSHFSQVSWERHCKWFDDARDDATKRIYSILVGPDATFAGRLDLKNIHAVNRHAELTVNLLRPYRGKGIGTQAMKLALDIAWKKLELNKVYLQVMVTNAHAIALYESVGFEREGTLRQHRYFDGQFHDFDIMAVFRPENA